MPGGDRTGPFGYGPMTGRGAGYCAGYRDPGYMNPAYGRGRGFGGGGRGWRHMYFATGLPLWARGYPANPAWTGYAGPAYYGEFTPEQEVEALKAQSDFFQKQIDVLNERIREVEDFAAKKRDPTA
jgi:hypothetical protein